jgi:hypothetical protein
MQLVLSLLETFQSQDIECRKLDSFEQLPRIFGKRRRERRGERQWKITKRKSFSSNNSYILKVINWETIVKLNYPYGVTVGPN